MIKENRTYLIGSTVHEQVYLPKEGILLIIQWDSNVNTIPWLIMEMSRIIQDETGKKSHSILTSSKNNRINFELLQQVTYSLLEQLIRDEKNAKITKRLELYLKWVNFLRNKKNNIPFSIYAMYNFQLI